MFDGFRLFALVKNAEHFAFEIGQFLYYFVTRISYIFLGYIFVSVSFHFYIIFNKKQKSIIEFAMLCVS